MALTAAPADQELLLDLQTVDSKLQQLSARAAKLPEAAALAALESERAELERSLGALTGALEDTQAELKRVEADVAVVVARAQRDRDRLAASSSVKDVEALELELASLAGRQSELEDIELAVMEQLEERDAALSEVQDQAAELDASIASARQARDAAAEAVAEEAGHTRAARVGLEARIPADLLDLYEKQRARYGIGASMLRGGVSLAAGVALGAADLDRVRAADPNDVLLCPESSAILVRTAESGL